MFNLVLCRQVLSDDLHSKNPFTATKFIVFERHLVELLSVCQACRKPCHVQQKGKCGTSADFHCHCFCRQKFCWPFSYRLPLRNLVLAAAAFFTACSPTRLINTFQHANIACFSIQTFNSLQAFYLVPSVSNVWKRCQECLFNALQGKDVKLAGDGRCNSPGYCAKYGSYMLMDAETSEVLHMELVRVVFFSLNFFFLTYCNRLQKMVQTSNFGVILLHC